MPPPPGAGPRPRGCAATPLLPLLAAAALAAAAVAAAPFLDVLSPDIALPSDVKTCHRLDPHLDECVRQLLNSLVGHTAKGVPLLGIPPVDPLELPLMDLSGLAPTNMTLRLLLRGVLLHGISGMRVLSVKTNMEEGKLEVAGRIPRLWLSGTFDAKGDLLHFPLMASGVFYFNMTDVSAVCILYFREEPAAAGGPDYFTTDDMKVDIAPVGISLSFGDQLDGDNRLGETLNEFLNLNAHEIFSVVRAPASVLVTKALRQVLDVLLAALPSHQLIPD